MRFFGDYHLHSTYSDGRASVGEMVTAGISAGLEEIGFAEHGPRNIGTGIKSQNSLLQLQEELKQYQKEYPEVRLLTGLEANIISGDGELDVSRNIIRKLDYLIAGLHPYIRPAQWSDLAWVAGNSLSNINVVPGLGWRRRIKNENTKALVETIYRYEPLAISHPGLKMPIDPEEIVKACLAKGTCWEINSGHKFPNHKEVNWLAQQGVNFLVNSDAHFPESVGALEYGAWVLTKAGVPLSQVKNARE